jgi:hypothetical protein
MCDDNPNGPVDSRLLTFAERRNDIERKNNIKLPFLHGLQFDLRLLSVIHRERSYWRFLLTLSQFSENDLLNSISVDITLEGPDFRNIAVADSYDFELSAAKNYIGSLLPGAKVMAKLLRTNNVDDFPYELQVSCDATHAQNAIRANHKVPAFVNPAAFAFAADVNEVTPGVVCDRKCAPKASDANVSCCHKRTRLILPDKSEKCSAWEEEPGTDRCPGGCPKPANPAVL